MLSAGLFLGSASVIQSAGRALFLGYAIAGFIAFLIMRQLGEMVVEESRLHSFSHLPTNTGAVLPVSLPAGTTRCFTFWVAMAGAAAVGNTFSSGIEINTGFCGSVLRHYQRHQPDQRKVFGEMGSWFAIIKSHCRGGDDYLGGWLLLRQRWPLSTVRNL